MFSKIHIIGKAVLIVAALFFLGSCGSNVQDSFATLSESLKGDWVSEGNVKVYFKWRLKNDTVLEGTWYNLQDKRDTLLLKRFLMFVKKDTLFLKVLGDKATEKQIFKADRTGKRKVVFVNQAPGYPYFIIFLTDDKKWQYFQSNQRKHRTVAFDMKPINDR
jgi:hypothetical protein